MKNKFVLKKEGGSYRNEKSVEGRRKRRGIFIIHEQCSSCIKWWIDKNVLAFFACPLLLAPERCNPFSSVVYFRVLDTEFLHILKPHYLLKCLIQLILRLEEERIARQIEEEELRKGEDEDKRFAFYLDPVNPSLTVQSTWESERIRR